MGLNKHSLTFHSKQEYMFKLDMTMHNMHNPCKFIIVNNIQSNFICTCFLTKNGPRKLVSYE